MILLVDNYDSFTYNLAQYIEEFSEVTVIRNDDPMLLQHAAKATGIVLSPGPGEPKDAGLLLQLIKEFYLYKPLLGICLGHEGIGEVFGAQLEIAKAVRHGKISQLQQMNQSPLFQQIPEYFAAMRYHSLILAKENFPSTLKVLARSTDDEEIMAVQVEGFPVYGLQFHPESIGTPEGKQMIQNFISIVEQEEQQDD
ncbi:anthranilate synthase component II [Carnobacterium gallinarum]|uniref:anthranilate synthase component II n=1 Tax=Carnobacterium gallinarum TaxID=2749 RepID=UPI000557D7C2|nr:aminodeoxychorismate/anthranilate synthase component II [Carnobacterium gallinarum]